MYCSGSILVVIKTFLCLVLILTLALLAPSASHATSGMHGDYHAMISQADDQDAEHMHKFAQPKAPHGDCGAVAETAADAESSGQCCSGVCFSVFLGDTVSDFVEQATSGKYLTLHAQAESIEPSGFLRPPHS